jgi:hypothetical protein
MFPEEKPQFVSDKPHAPDSGPSPDNHACPKSEPQTGSQALLFCLRCGAALPGGVNACGRCKAKVCVGCGE